MRRLPALFMTVRSEIAEKPGEEHQARGTTFLLITPSLWPRASRVNIGDYSRSAREYCGLGEGTTIGHCDVDLSAPVADQLHVFSHDVRGQFILYEKE